MAKHYKEVNRSLQDLVDGGKWTEFVKALKTGIYEVNLKDYSCLRSLQVIISRFNADMDYKYKFTTSVNYKNTPIRIRIEVDKR